jgi:hypothetical protein
MVDDVVAAFEDPVREPVVPHILPNVLDRIEFGRFGGQWDERHVFGHVQLCGDVPAGLIHEQHGVGSRLNVKRDLLQMQLHGLGVAKWQNETGRLAERGTDGAEDIGRGGSLILQGKWPRSAGGPASRDLVLLTDAGFILEPQFERLAGGCRDIREDIGDFFLNVSTAASSCL